MLILLGEIVIAKLLNTQILLDTDEPWKYISKFAVDIGEGSWSLKARYSTPEIPNSAESLDSIISIYLDDNWETTFAIPSCIEKHRLAKRNNDLKIPLNGDWSEEIEGTLTQQKHPHFWYFSVSSCELTSKVQLTVFLEIKNSNNSHFSSDEKALIYLYPSLLLVFLLALSGNLYRLVEILKKTDEFEGSLLIFNVSISLEFLGIIFENLHLLIYSRNGKGAVVFDFFYESLDVISSLLITTLFILIAYGWNLKSKQNPEPEKVISIVVLVGLAEFLVIGLCKLTDDSHNKFSTYDGLPGWIVLFIKLGLWIWFSYTLFALYKSSRPNLHWFIFTFGILSSIYLLGFPLLLFISYIFTSYFRKTLISIGYQLIQIFCYFSLSLLFREKSSYMKVSTQNFTVLPSRINFEEMASELEEFIEDYTETSNSEPNKKEKDEGIVYVYIDEGRIEAYEGLELNIRSKLVFINQKFYCMIFKESQYFPQVVNNYIQEVRRVFERSIEFSMQENSSGQFKYQSSVETPFKPSLFNVMKICSKFFDLAKEVQFSIEELSKNAGAREELKSTELRHGEREYREIKTEIIDRVYYREKFGVEAERRFREFVVITIHTQKKVKIILQSWYNFEPDSEGLESFSGLQEQFVIDSDQLESQIKNIIDRYIRKVTPILMERKRSLNISSNSGLKGRFFSTDPNQFGVIL